MYVNGTNMLVHCYQASNTTISIETTPEVPILIWSSGQLMQHIILLVISVRGELLVPLVLLAH